MIKLVSWLIEGALLVIGLIFIFVAARYLWQFAVVVAVVAATALAMRGDD